MMTLLVGCAQGLIRMHLSAINPNVMELIRNASVILIALRNYM